MDKKFTKYFGRNVSRTVYLIGLGIIGFGLVQIFLGNPYGGGIFCTLGAILFLLTSHKQVSDKNIDELVKKYESEYVSKVIDNKTFGKETLKGSDFSVFSGFIRDDGDVRFKAGKDTKIRTSRFYITAVSAEKKDCKIFTTVYDIISEGTPVDRCIFTKGADEIEFSKEKLEFPIGNYQCRIKVTKGESSEELMFYIPDDALADKLLDKIK